ncbi:hypothetical protein BC332_17846 [Capsicum chinense]|nr:hypothetical protein BC332_17846 [Capsicum chinense]
MPLQQQNLLKHLIKVERLFSAIAFGESLAEIDENYSPSFRPILSFFLFSHLFINEVGPSLPGSSNLPANANSGELPLYVAPEKIALFLDQSLKLLGEDPIMTSIKRCEKEKDDNMDRNDGVEFSSISARDSPGAIAEKRVSQLLLGALEDFATVKALVVHFINC